MESFRYNDIFQNITEDKIKDLLKDMVAIPSHTGIKNRERELAIFIHDYFKQHGIRTHIHNVKDERCNVIARLSGKGGGKDLLLTGHLDTVPPYNMKNPYKLKEQNGRLYGLGTVDMKASIACMMIAMSELHNSGTELFGDVIFAGVIDEENKSAGTQYLLKSGLRAHGAIVGEPTESQICIGHRGLEWFEIVFKGRTVHGGKQSEGVNAIEKSKNFMDCVDKELLPKLKTRVHPIIGGSSMNYGFITGGTQPSTVAGECILRFDRRWIPGEKFENVLMEYEDILERLRKNDPQFCAELYIMEDSKMEDGFIHEYLETNPNSEIVRALKRAYIEINDKEPIFTSFPAWTDGGLLSTYGNIPTVVFGPGSIKTAHSIEEHIEKSELQPAAKIYAATSIIFAGERS